MGGAVSLIQKEKATPCLIEAPRCVYEAGPLPEFLGRWTGVTMAKTSKINKNELRKKVVAKYLARRQELKALVHKKDISPEERADAQLKLAKLPRDANPVRVVNRCMVTGRPRGNLRYFQLCRITFREKALKGELTGVVKASW
jgi:small subunit ribosomal protein S14